MKYYVRFPPDRESPAHLFRIDSSKGGGCKMSLLSGDGGEDGWTHNLKNESTAVSLEELVENPQWFPPEYYALMLTELL